MTKRMKILLFSGLGLLLAASLTVLIALFPVARPVMAREADVGAFSTAEPIPVQPAAPPPAVIEEPTDETAFILRDLNGYIAVYRLPEIDLPDMVTGINTRTLRLADWNSLQEGIRVDGWDNLQKALEDFGS